MEKIHKELSEAREEMERNPTPQNVRRHSQLKVDLDKKQKKKKKKKTDTNPGKLENKNSLPQHGERLPKTLVADKVTEWRQLRVGQNNTANHKWSCHRKGGSKRPCQSF